MGAALAMDGATRQFVLDLLGHVNDMTLATVRPDGFPQATTVSFANDGLHLYVGAGIDSQKAHNIRQNNKVSLTVTAPYQDWMQIRGLSMAGLASFVSDAQELAVVTGLMELRYPQIKSMVGDANKLPWGGALFIKIAPTVISVLDYRQGFGHTTLVTV